MQGERMAIHYRNAEIHGRSAAMRPIVILGFVGVILMSGLICPPLRGEPSKSPPGPSTLKRQAAEERIAEPSAAEEVGKIEGRVNVNGVPLAEGKITFSNADGQFFGGKIKAGVFQIKVAPPGDWRVAIKGKGAPKKYASARSSALTASVRPGNNLLEFTLLGEDE
jgi:hypothetical protein